jgi:2',3'-cyclic-nucleotide 2'-phosphodiesterase (5'-nucleotidase family)
MSAETDLPDNVITKDYLIKILEHHHHNNKVDLIGYQVGSAAAKGENYASVILRVSLEYKIRDGIDDDVDEVHRLSLIVKTKSDNAEVDDLLTELSVFKKEAVTYSIILSEVAKLLLSHGDCVVLSPE